jgi:hypothetical protein
MVTANFIRKEEIVGFNSVIEGSYHDEWTTLNYKLADLNLQEDDAIINDGTYKYLFFGRTADFKSVDRILPLPENCLEIKIDSLSFGSGIVLPFRGGIPNILERPRAISFKDGRIFIESNMISDARYLKAIPEILKTASELFANKQINETYRQLMESYNFQKEERGEFIIYS